MSITSDIADATSLGSQGAHLTNTRKGSPHMKKLIYIAGPMRGFPGWNYHEFNSAADYLRKTGWAVINPVDIGNLFGTPEYLEQNKKILDLVMCIELEVVRRCDAIVLLPGWELSVGAISELSEAIENNVKILTRLPTSPKEIFGD